MIYKFSTWQQTRAQHHNNTPTKQSADHLKSWDKHIPSTDVIDKTKGRKQLRDEQKISTEIELEECFSAEFEWKFIL